MGLNGFILKKKKKKSVKEKKNPGSHLEVGKPQRKPPKKTLRKPQRKPQKPTPMNQIKHKYNTTSTPSSLTSIHRLYYITIYLEVGALKY